MSAIIAMDHESFRKDLGATKLFQESPDTITELAPCNNASAVVKEDYYCASSGTDLIIKLRRQNGYV